MFKYVLKDINETRKSIKNKQLNQQKRINEFNENYQKTLISISSKKENFKKIEDEIDKELSRHF